jgi:predicted transcriptional regulator
MIGGKMLKDVARLVSAYVANNTVSVAELPNIIAQFHAALTGAVAPAPEVLELVPAVSIRRSITPDFIICLEDGKKLKMLKRHLQTAYGLTPDEYRAKWGLPHDYPMVAPNYAEQRSELAKKIGLGKKRGGRRTKVAAASVGRAPRVTAKGQGRR